MNPRLDHVELRQGQYFDSVTLMQASQAIAALDGVDRALIAMATPLNVELAQGQGFVVPQSVPADLLIAVRAASQTDIDLAVVTLGETLSARAPAGRIDRAMPAPRTVAAALTDSDAALALVSVPGQYAALEAHDAIAAGRSVMIFSDGVSVADEVALKTAGRDGGVLVMGPDCGTAIVGGIALGFANVVRRGPVGIVAASGTGAQQISSLLEAAGVGVSHLLGLGGRDLSADVGGLGAELALCALDEDPETELILVVSKPPDPGAAQRLQDRARTMKTPVQFALLGAGQPDLTQAVESALESLGAAAPPWPVVGQAQTARAPAYLSGYFVGGTLAAEALVLAEELAPMASNLAPPTGGSAPRVPPDRGWLGEDLAAQALAGPGHVVVDFGTDDMTEGRAHPMIDPTLRLDQIDRLGRTGSGDRVLLLDVVLGYGAEPDPAASLVPALRAAADRFAQRGARLPMVVSLCGTQGDPQGWAPQAAALAGAGALVFTSNALAARHAVALARGRTDPGAEACPGAAR